MEAVRRLRFVQLDIEDLATGLCRARVELAGPSSASYTGVAEGDASAVGKMECAARAAVDAVRHTLNSDDVLELQAVKTVYAFDSEAVLVSVSFRRESAIIDLVGFCLAPEDPSLAAALAVLNGTNRQLGFYAG